MLTIEFANEKESHILKAECPSCSSSKLRSKGLRWACSKCGKQFNKITRRRIVPKREQRPSCPECGAGKPILDGRSLRGEERYVCIRCGRNYQEGMSGLNKMQMEVEVE